MIIKYKKKKKINIKRTTYLRIWLIVFLKMEYTSINFPLFSPSFFFFFNFFYLKFFNFTFMFNSTIFIIFIYHLFLLNRFNYLIVALGGTGVNTFMLFNSIALQLLFLGLSIVLPNPPLDWLAICLVSCSIWFSKNFIEASLFLWTVGRYSELFWQKWLLLLQMQTVSFCCWGCGGGMSGFKVLLFEYLRLGCCANVEL